MSNITPLANTGTASFSGPSVNSGTPSSNAVEEQTSAKKRRSMTLFMRPDNNSKLLFAPRKAVKDMSARERFETLHKRFKPAAAKGVDVRFQFDLSGSGGGKWWVEIKNGKLTVKEGTGPNPTATMRASASDYLKIANGEMNKMFAFIRGKLKVEGDKEALKKFDSYFQ